MIVAHARCYTDNSHSTDFEKKNHPKRYKTFHYIILRFPPLSHATESSNFVSFPPTA